MVGFRSNPSGDQHLSDPKNRKESVADCDDKTGGSSHLENLYQLGGSTSPIDQIASGFAFPYAIGLQNKGKPLGTVGISDLNDRNSDTRPDRPIG